LVMEVVATEDIEGGQEVFIDYGKEWSEGELILFFGYLLACNVSRIPFPSRGSCGPS